MIFADFHEIWSDFLRFSWETLQLLEISRFQFNFSVIIPDIHLIFDLIFDLILFDFTFNFHIGTTPDVFRRAVTLFRKCDPTISHHVQWARPLARHVGGFSVKRKVSIREMRHTTSDWRKVLTHKNIFRSSHMQKQFKSASRSTCNLRQINTDNGGTDQIMDSRLIDARQA